MPDASQPSARPGPRNLITDVAGIRVGNAVDARAWTGVSVVLPDQRAVMAADVRGGAPGTREIHALDPSCLVDRADAVVLSGGSVFGLEAASGVVARLAADGRGFVLRSAVIPIVPAAILFDLVNGGDKSWGETPPYRRLGMDAVAAAAQDFLLGNVGAGYGAKAHRLKGGLGSASAVTSDGIEVGALVAVNSYGPVTIGDSKHFWAWALEQDGEFGGIGPPKSAIPLALEMPLPAASVASPAVNTTIAVIATNATLGKAEAERVAIMAQDGLARAIRPAHTPFDGDTVFAIATGRVPLVDALMLARIGSLAADCLARAICRGVYEAETLGRFPGYRSLA
ncbi:MAG: P1 family peptidase [Proteobacteria bacterium]|nr:P1 family peptidase [Pseudomonadota bacterium]MBI3495842.1 P1 family peptidase [Pseudomonadota bacterium]